MVCITKWADQLNIVFNFQLDLSKWMIRIREGAKFLTEVHNTPQLLGVNKEWRAEIWNLSSSDQIDIERVSAANE